jgi:hypothetical protein
MIIAAAVVLSPSAFAQYAEVDQRIVQSIRINGQLTQGALVVQNGTIQTPSCDSPAQYVTPNQSETGWACFEQTTGMWLLHALPPSQSVVVQTQQSPTVIYSVPNTIYVPTYSYSYPYYGYGYYGSPYLLRPRYGFGFGFNVGHGFHNGHRFANGGFVHAAPRFGHGGGGFVRGGFGGHMHGGRR